MRSWIPIVIIVPLAACAMGAASCGGAFTQADIDRAAIVAGDAAARKAKAESVERMYAAFVKLGLGDAKARELAEAESDKVAEIARKAAEDLTRKAMGPPRQEGGGILAGLGAAALQLALGFAQAKWGRS
jgi:hypothetical protein